MKYKLTIRIIHHNHPNIIAIAHESNLRRLTRIFRHPLEYSGCEDSHLGHPKWHKQHYYIFSRHTSYITDLYYNQNQKLIHIMQTTNCYNCY